METEPGILVGLSGLEPARLEKVGNRFSADLLTQTGTRLVRVERLMRFGHQDRDNSRLLVTTDTAKWQIP